MKIVIFWGKNRTKLGNSTKPGTALIKTTLTGESLQIPGHCDFMPNTATNCRILCRKKQLKFTRPCKMIGYDAIVQILASTYLQSDPPEQIGSIELNF